MPKFIISWDAGYGERADIVEAKDQDDADMAAYQAWREDAESEASYGAEPYTDELAKRLDLKDDDEGDHDGPAGQR
ncbi:MAG: hypothetical protein AAFR65_10470 [Pseudomonadota bacterium]